jgi:hypothetical protein
MGMMMASAWRRLCGAAPWAGVAALGALLLLLLAVLASHYFQNPTSFNSDDLYCSGLCEDLLRGRELRGWHLPGAPYTFPDVLLLLPCHALFANVGDAFLAYAFLFYPLLLAALAWVLRQAGLSWRASLAAAAAGVLFLVAGHLRPPGNGRGMLLFRAGNHAGCFLVALLLAGCVLRGLRRGFRWPGGVVTLAAGALGGFSDRLLLVQFVAPLLVALGVLGVKRLVPARRLAAAAGLLGLATVLAFQAKPLFARLGFVLMRDECDFHPFAPFDPSRFLHRLFGCTHDQPITRAALAFHLTAGMLLALAWLRRPRPAGGPGPDRAAALFVVLALWAAPVCNLAAITCAGLTEHPAIDRYLHACFILPFLTAGVWLSLAPWPALRAGAALGHAGIALFAISLGCLLFPHLERQPFAARYPPVAQALDDMVRRHGRLRGISGFWPARELSFLTRERVHLRSVNDLGAAYPHANSIHAYLSDDPHDTSVPDYHFIVFAPDAGKMMPSPAFMLCEYGEPLERTQVGDHCVWRYARLEGRRWEMFLRAQLALRLRHEWPYLTPAEPQTLQIPKANLTRWNRGCHVPVPRGRPVEVRFDRPVTGKLLDISANFSDQLRLRFYRGEELVATARVPAVWWAGNAYDGPGMQSRLVPLPAACHDHAWDRVVITPDLDIRCCTVGHFLVYQQELPYRLVHGLAPGQQRRYEGEILPTPDTPDVYIASKPDELPALRVVPDPAASGGRVRQAAARYSGLMTVGPSAFLPPGRYRVDFHLAVAEVAAGPVATLRIVSDAGRNVVCGQVLGGTDFPAPGRFARHSITFDVAEELDVAEFRVESTGRTAVSLDCIDLTRLSDAVDSPEPPRVESLVTRSR